MAFVRWNQNTNIWEVAVTPENPATLFNHLPIANPTLPLDTANKQYVDSLIGGGPFVPYVGATANVQLGNFSIFATDSRIKGTVNALGPTLGSLTGVNFAVVEANTSAYGLAFGQSGTGDPWIQSQRFDGGLATYNIRLNPSGGAVIAGGSIYERNRPYAIGDWQPFYPTWKSYGGIDGVVGNGYLVTRYTIIGNTVYYFIQLGIGTTTVLPSGHWMFTLPVPTNNSVIEASGHIYDGTTGAIRQIAGIPAAFFFGVPSYIGFITGNAVNSNYGFINSGNPWTWKANDSLWITGFYEIT